MSALWEANLERVLQDIGRERVHVELLDDLKHDARGVYLRALAFMEVPDDGRTTFPKENAGRRIRNSWLFALLRSRMALSMAIRFKELFGLRTLGFGRPDRPMPSPIRVFLAEQFKGEIALIEQLIERDLSHWLMSERRNARKMR